MAIVDCWSGGIQSLIVIVGFAALGTFFAWRNKKIVVTIAAVTIGLLAFTTVAFC
jgi:hypothetical protein